ncbi:MAG: site-specific DNA-methyltransferase [Promethearchaeota archaeon]|nr:MAG: site-specific DNA-methyltransferase [Candidatus Lokiarchaeota archaeon]
MPTLKWEAKDNNDTSDFEIKDPMHLQTKEIIIDPGFQDSINEELQIEDQSHNLLILGENKSIMKELLSRFANKIDLIYIDPPFATGGNFPLKINIGEGEAYQVVPSYSDYWKGGMDEYLNFLYERILLMKKLLADTGSIYVHLDWHVVHYIKLMMDEIFGIDNFRNEIIWMYPAASARTRNFFIRSYDTILFYTKSENYIFNDDPNIYMEYSNRVKNALKEDEKGKFYYRGGSHDGKKLSRKVYVKQDGIFPRDIWNDIPYVRANTAEYQAFSTQKPERLLKRIILASTNENQLVADFFCGSGTTLIAAEKLGRKWIGCDSMSHAINICRKRILNATNSLDLISWKEKYKNPPKIFEIKHFKGKQNRFDLGNQSLINEPEKALEKGEPRFNFKVKQDKDSIIIILSEYIIPFLEFVELNVKNKINTFLDWIDYWAIDFHYKDEVFKPIWWSFRTPKDRTLCSKSKIYHYKKKGIMTIAIKVIDILGFETVQTFELDVK